MYNNIHLSTLVQQHTSRNKKYMMWGGCVDSIQCDAMPDALAMMIMLKMPVYVSEPKMRESNK